MAVEAFRAGADDYLAALVAGEALAASLARLDPKKPGRGGAVLIGESEAMVSLRAVIRRIGATPCNVLIEGETGTGKDVVARLLHEASPRAAHPFVAINCSAVPDTLFESELFGTSAAPSQGRTLRPPDGCRPATAAPCSSTKSASSG